MSMEMAGPSSGKSSSASKEALRDLMPGRWTALTDRSLETYKDFLALEDKELMDTKVLDVGSGLREKFSRQAKKKFNTEVFSVNPKLKSWITRKRLQTLNPGWQERSVAAAAEELPFIDSYFDAATSLFAVSFYKTINQEQAVKEIIRTLKPGAKLHMAPRGLKGAFSHILDTYVTAEDVLGADTIEWLKANGHTISKNKTGPIIITKKVEESKKG